MADETKKKPAAKEAKEAKPAAAEGVEAKPKSKKAAAAGAPGAAGAPAAGAEAPKPGEIVAGSAPTAVNLSRFGQRRIDDFHESRR